jgi:hypothetical protein
MALPKFSAEASLYKTHEFYQTLPEAVDAAREPSNLVPQRLAGPGGRSDYTAWTAMGPVCISACSPVAVWDASITAMRTEWLGSSPRVHGIKLAAPRFATDPFRQTRKPLVNAGRWGQPASRKPQRLSPCCMSRASRHSFMVCRVSRRAIERNIDSHGPA